MLTGQPITRNRKIFYGWWLVAACSFFNFLVGGTFYYGFTAFFNPIRNDFGWTSAQTALGFSLQRLEAGIAAPVIGFIFDRVGPRKLILLGMIVAGGGLIYMSQIQSLVGFYIAFFITAIGVSVAWVGPPMYAVSNWFIRRRAKALSLLMAGTGLGGLVVPLLVLLITQTGWRVSLMTVGLVYCLISIPLAIIIKHRPEKYGYLPDGDTVVTPSPTLTTQTLGKEINQNGDPPPLEINFDIREALRTRAFWLISTAFTLSQFAATAVMVLEMPHLESIYISREVAGLAVTFTTLLILVGSLGSGFPGDAIKKSYLVAGALALQCLGLIILANIHQPWQLIPFVIVYGIGYGATIPMRPALIADYFGRTNIGTVLGLLLGITLLGSVLSPVIAGWFFDLHGDYRGIFTIYAVVLSLAIPAILLARKPFKEQRTRSIS